MTENDMDIEDYATSTWRKEKRERRQKEQKK